MSLLILYQGSNVYIFCNLLCFLDDGTLSTKNMFIVLDDRLDVERDLDNLITYFLEIDVPIFILFDSSRMLLIVGIIYSFHLGDGDISVNVGIMGCTFSFHTTMVSSVLQNKSNQRGHCGGDKPEVEICMDLRDMGLIRHVETL